jgi:hypothetical protein
VQLAVEFPPNHPGLRSVEPRAPRRVLVAESNPDFEAKAIELLTHF